MTAPNPDLPSAGQLRRSTVIAAVVAAALLVAVVLPAEYGRDPTGIGRIIGLTEMGEVKMALAAEAAANAAALASADSIVAASESAATAPTAATIRADTVTISLAPGAGAEVKLSMDSYARARYKWSARGGAVNFDMHGDSAGAPAGWFVSYRKGTAVAADSGELVAGFPGSHGWFWRNRGSDTLGIRLETSGQYRSVQLPR